MVVAAAKEDEEQYEDHGENYPFDDDARGRLPPVVVVVVIFELSLVEGGIHGEVTE